MEIDFTWDAEKARRNIVKHGVSFEVAKSVFSDPFLILVEDREVDGELRYHALGHTPAGQLLVCVFVERFEGRRHMVRIISSREADKHEQRTYSYQFTTRH